MWIKIRDLIKSVAKKSVDYDEKYIKIKSYSDDELPLNKTIEIAVMLIVLRAIFFFFFFFFFNITFLIWLPLWNMNNIKMLYYDRIDVSEGIDANKTSASKQCDIYHYCISWIIVLTFKQVSAIGVMIY